MRKLAFVIGLLILTCCNSSTDQKKAPGQETVEVPGKSKAYQEKIIEEYLNNCALKHPVYSQERQRCLDAGLEKDSTIAYLWQQKAMPLFKQGKYEAGMGYIDRAVELNPQRWQPYRAFIKCIFAKTYKAAIADFEDLLERHGNNYVMDHTYKFHIGLSYLQLEEYSRAEAIFEEDLQEQREKWGPDGLHQLDLFYYGISKFEQGKWEEAIVQFDSSLKIYPKFSEAQYYKGVSLMKLSRKEEAFELIKLAQENGLAGNTINEDNVIYERYPYQIRWN